MNYIKNLFFFGHLLFIFNTMFNWIFYDYIIYVQLLTIISWHFNSNKCLITQIEYFLFKETLSEHIIYNFRYFYVNPLLYLNPFYNKKSIIIRNISKFKVPAFHRLFLYFIFSINIIYTIAKTFILL